MSTTTPSQLDKASTGLSPVLSARWVLTWRHLAACLFFGGLFLIVNFQPLRNATIWLDVHQGQRILEHGSLPAAKTAWLSQALCGLIDGQGGPQALSGLMASTILVGLIILARGFFLTTGRMSVALLGVGILLPLGYFGHSPAIPETLGLVCLATLLWLVLPIGKSRHPWILWPGAALLFAAWANLHESYLLGIAILACLAVGQVASTLSKTQNISALASDRPTRRLVLLTGLAAVASLINPLGLSLLGDANLLHVSRWLPLHLSAAILALVIGPYLGRRWPAEQPDVETQEEPTKPEVLSPRSFTVTLTCALVVWCCFALSPLGNCILGGQPRNVEQVVGPQVSQAAAEYLQENPGRGTVFAPIHWANWLLMNSPADARVFATTDIQSPQALADYVRIARGKAGWNETLTRHGVDTIVVDKKGQGSLAQAVRKSPMWRTVFEDKTTLVSRAATDPSKS